MTNDIVRLSDALTRDTERTQFREKLNKDSDKIRESLSRSGEYRIPTSRGDIVIKKKTA